MKTPLYLLALMLTTSILHARQPVDRRAPLQAEDLQAIKSRWQTLLEDAGKTGEPERVQAYAEQLLRGSLSSRGGFERHFGGSLELDATKESIGKVIRLATSAGNPAQRIGYLRELKYLNAVARDGRFSIEGNSVTQVSRIGRVEFDAILQHRATGKIVRMEIKEVNMRTANLGELKGQIIKLGAAAREDGVRQIWVNRFRIPSEIRGDFVATAEANGVSVYDGISTGRSVQTLQKFATVLDREHDLAMAAEDCSKIPCIVNAIGPWAMRAGVTVSVCVVGYSLYKWQTGEISGKQFARVATETASGAASGWLGMEGGAAIGTLIVPGVGTVVGGAVGCIAGTWVAFKVNQLAFDAITAPPPHHQSDMAQQEEAFLKFLQGCYAVR